MKRRLLSALAFFLGLSIPSFAQNSIQVQAPNMVAADEQFNVTFIIEGENAPSDFQWSPGEDFKLVWGPLKGSSTSISIVNGKKTRSSQTTYTYILMPKATGTFRLAAATATVKGEKISSGRPSLEVVQNGASASSGSSSRSSSGSGSSGSSRQAAAGEIASSDLFLRLSLNRSSVVVGEPVTATLKLYQRVNVTGFEDAKFPTFNGFWSQEVFAPTSIEFHRENIDDKIYNAAVLRRWVLIPQQSGDVAIDPAELVCQVAVRTQSGSRSIFDSFFDDDVRTLRKRLFSGRQVVHVSPLPAGAPASFGGGVGTFTMTTRLSKDSLRAHDAASLLVTVSGKGNVSLLDAPKVHFPPDFDVYDVKVTESTDKSTGKTSGSKTFEYPFIPRSHGEFTVDPVTYSYYDVSARKYVTLSGQPQILKVARGSGTEDPVSSEGLVVPAVRGKDVRDLGSDIRYISTARPSFSDKDSFFCFSPLFWLLLVLLVCLAALVWGLQGRMAARKADVAGSRNRGAVKMARRRLSQAGGFLQKNLYTAFYEELHKALQGYVSDKLNIDMSDMSKEYISSSLQEAGVPAAHAASLTDLLDACEYARYSPDSGHEAMNAHYEQALSALAAIESDMKKKSPSHPLALLLMVTLSLAAFSRPVMLSAARHPASATADSLWSRGVAAYADGRWEDALQAWLSIESEGLESAALYSNIGDAWYKSGDLARAILYYERALKLDPSCADARYNLALAHTFLQDRIESVPEFFLAAWSRQLGNKLSSNTWTLLFFILLAGSLASLLVFLLGRAPGWRKAGFYLAILPFLFSAGALSVAAGQRAAARRTDTAIILRPVVTVRSSPGSEGAKDLFVLHEGTKVRILDRVGDWQNVSLSDGRQGWISASDAGLI
ncbi:MAG: BatD family protein [Bacteroidales bacterium]|nr:BatD family protein [Bacteroidales bacterium]